jgi:hypothetical protein
LDLERNATLTERRYIEKHESSRISQKTLRKLQDRPAQGRHSRHLQQQASQATARIINLWHASLV